MNLNRYFVFKNSVSTMFTRQKALEQESKELVLLTSKYTKQTKQWLTLVNDFNDALKVKIIIINRLSLSSLFFFCFYSFKKRKEYNNKKRSRVQTKKKKGGEWVTGKS